jgi:hypothetical protein
MDVIAFAGAVIAGILTHLIASELFVWMPRLSERLMRCAVRLAPGPMQERMQEEWEGHLQAIPPGLWRIVTATGFLIASLRFSLAARFGSTARTRVETRIDLTRPGAKFMATVLKRLAQQQDEIDLSDVVREVEDAFRNPPGQITVTRVVLGPKERLRAVLARLANRGRAWSVEHVQMRHLNRPR